MTDSHNPALLPLLAPTNLDSFYCGAVESLFRVLVANLSEMVRPDLPVQPGSMKEEAAKEEFERGLKIVLRAYELASDVFVKYR